jgi:hypothetical protein
LRWSQAGIPTIPRHHLSLGRQVRGALRTHRLITVVDRKPGHQVPGFLTSRQPGGDQIGSFVAQTRTAKRILPWGCGVA